MSVTATVARVARPSTGVCQTGRVVDGIPPLRQLGFSSSSCSSAVVCRGEMSRCALCTGGGGAGFPVTSKAMRRGSNNPAFRGSRFSRGDSGGGTLARAARGRDAARASSAFRGRRPRDHDVGCHQQHVRVRGGAGCTRCGAVPEPEEYVNAAMGEAEKLGNDAAGVLHEYTEHQLERLEHAADDLDDIVASHRSATTSSAAGDQGSGAEGPPSNKQQRQQQQLQEQKQPPAPAPPTPRYHGETYPAEAHEKKYDSPTRSSSSSVENLR